MTESTKWTEFLRTGFTRFTGLENGRRVSHRGLKGEGGNQLDRRPEVDVYPKGRNRNPIVRGPSTSSG